MKYEQIEDPPDWKTDANRDRTRQIMVAGGRSAELEGGREDRQTRARTYRTHACC